LKTKRSISVFLLYILHHVAILNNKGNVTG